jgi:hypothetical protein
MYSCNGSLYLEDRYKIQVGGGMHHIPQWHCEDTMLLPLWEPQGTYNGKSVVSSQKHK